MINLIARFSHSMFGFLFCICLSFYLTDGVCVVDPDYLKTRKVFGLIVVAFRYGREDMDVMGVSFRKDFAVKQIQIYPPLEENQQPLTKLQAKLLNKLGENAVPFHYDVRHVFFSFGIYYWSVHNFGCIFMVNHFHCHGQYIFREKLFAIHFIIKSFSVLL